MTERAVKPAATELTTDRLVLRPQTLAAARAVLAGSDAGLDLADGFPHADTFDALRMFVEHGSSDHDGGWWITLREDGRVVGDCGTHGWTDDDGVVEIGYGMAAPYRQRGYATEAVAAMSDWIAAAPGVAALAAGVEVGNEASRRLLERIGFALTGEADGHWKFRRPTR